MAEIEAEFPEKVRFLFKPARYKVLYGGRGSAKSWSIARVLLLLAIQTKLRILCTREFQASLEESVHTLLKRQIEELGLFAHYRVFNNKIRGTNGSEFIFSGLRNNITKIKSLEAVDICWVEEAETISKVSWRILAPTIRKEGSEIWVSFNPLLDDDPTFQRFIVHAPPDSAVVEMNWRDNPWFPDSLRREKDYDYVTDPEVAEHVWEGKTLKFGKATILHDKWFVEEFEPGDDWSGPYHGVDWGFSTDPACMVKVWVTGDEDSLERELWIEREAYGFGVDNDSLPALFDKIPNAREHESRADNSRPETINHLNRHGYPRMVAADKWPGSVEDGILHLRGYKRIVIHPRCKYAKREATLWKWKTDPKTGEILPAPIDKHNHIWDAVRYALAPIIRHSDAPVDEEFGPDEQANPWKAGW